MIKTQDSTLHKKVMDIYSYVKENLYLCREDIDFKKKRYNSTLMFSILTGLINGKQMIYGEYGLGKTTSSENIISLIHGYPLDLVLVASLKGNPELTEEKIIGRPNLGKLNQGEEKVIWSDFVLLGPKIVDEINRISPSKQNILLEGIDRGKWKYLNEVLSNDSIAIYATGNYKDSGNNDVIPPLIDRFSVAVESKHPGINNLRYRRSKSSENILYDKDITYKMIECLNNESGDSKLQDIEALVNKFSRLKSEYRSSIKKKTGLELLDDSEIKNIQYTCENMPLSVNAYLFYDLFTSELSSCQVFGQKRSNEECPSGCHYKNYMCGKISNCLSIRTDTAIKNYAAAFAWLTGSQTIEPEHLEMVLPYNIWHKTKFKQEYVDEFVSEQRDDPLMLHIAKKSVSKMKRNFSKSRDEQLRMCKSIKDGKWNEVSEILKNNDHPVFREYSKI